MCKNLQIRILVLLALFSAGFAFAQPALTRTSFNSAYSPISSAGGASVSSATGDNAFEAAVPIGFTFHFLGTNYNSIGLNTNGIAAFSGITASANNTDLYTSSGPSAVLAPWWDDLDVSAGGSILYQTQGATGSRTFTIQWTNVHSFHTGSTAQLNFQIVLHEADSSIDFRYDTVAPSGTFSPQESASIGIKSAAGGNGQYIDAVTGSSFTGNGMLSASITWPARNFRFRPGFPAPINTGSFTVGTAGDYPNLSEAVADLNHRGVSGNGSVTFLLTDSVYDQTPAHGSNFFPVLIGPVSGTSIAGSVLVNGIGQGATIRSPGALAGTCVTQNNTAAITNTSEPILGWIGLQYSSLNNVHLVSSTDNPDRGLSVLNSSATMGVRYCGFQRVSVMLDRSNVNTIGIEQREPSAPTSSAGTNCFLIYQNLNISNVYSGILLDGNATFPDSSNTIGTNSALLYNSIGDSTANNIGNGTAYAYGILARNQSSVGIFNCEVQHVSVNGAVACDGIVLENARGASMVYNNKVHSLRNNSSTATDFVTGIRAGIAGTGTQQVRIFNNFIYGINSSYAGPASAVRQLKGIFVQPAGGGAASSMIEVDYNSVLINGGTAVSNACFESGTASGPVIHTRNNIFANTTSAQTAPAAHYCFASTSSSAIGNTGSISDHNDLYFSNAARGFTGIGNTTTYAALSAWTAAMAQDVNSLAVDPVFSAPNDLHVNTLALNAHALPLSWVSQDIDNDARNTSPDIGADEFSINVSDAGATTLAAPLPGDCYSGAEPVEIRITNYGTVPLNFNSDTVRIYAQVSGSATQSYFFLLDDNSLNSGFPLAPGAMVDVPVGTLNMSAAGTYVFSAYALMNGDTISSNDTMNTVSVQYNAGTISASALSACDSSSVTLTLSGNTSSAIQWQKSTDGGITWLNATGPGNTSPSFSPIITDTFMFRVLVCGALPTAPLTISSIPLPVAAFTDSISNGTVYFLDASAGAGSYSWDFGDNQTSTQQNPSHIYGISNTTYTVILTVSNGCGSDTASVQIPVTTETEENVITGIGIYPNPVKDQLSISFGESAEKVVLELFDAQGRLVLKTEEGGVIGGSTLQLDVKAYESGIYLLRIASGNKIRDERIVITR